MKFTILFIGLSISLLLSSIAASENISLTIEEKKSIENHFQQIFNSTENTQIDIRPTEVPGLFAVYLTDQVIYLHLGSKLMILGEVYDTYEIPLSKEEPSKRRLAKSNASPAVTSAGIGNDRIYRF
ncbi:MAG: hypothetical protein ACJA04_000245 [Cellvibrionaceae bacterium]|jgi:hypothetical protein